MQEDPVCADSKFGAFRQTMEFGSDSARSRSVQRAVLMRGVGPYRSTPLYVPRAFVRRSMPNSR